MRNPNRLDNFYNVLCNLHKTYFPDWRFGQFCSNFFGWMMHKYKIDLFFPEEDKMLELIKEFIMETSK